MEGRIKAVKARRKAGGSAIYSRCENRHNRGFVHRNDAQNSGWLRNRCDCEVARESPNLK